MAEDEGDKTEAPTPRRRQEARDQGQVARSQDLTSALMLLASLLLLRASGSHIVGVMKAFVARMLAASSLADLDSGTSLSSFAQGIEQVGVAMAPLLAGIVITAILANVLQVGMIFNVERLTPNFAALNPTRGLGRIFGSSRSSVTMLTNFVKLIVLMCVAYSGLHGRFAQIITAQGLDFSQIFLLGSQAIFSIALRVAIALLIIAIIEFIYQKWKMEQDLKMSKNEVKEEMRRMEGDPKIKARRRQIAIQRMQQKLKKDVPTADVVVTNPTHFAVALKYDKAVMHAPKVVAKGQDFMALRIREIAIEHGVPILERKPLARALYHTVKVGQEIPEEFYGAIAEILAYVYELNRKLRPRTAV